MPELRWLILFLGAVFVTAVYLATRAKGARRDGRRRGERRQEPVFSVDPFEADPWGDARREPELGPVADDVSEVEGPPRVRTPRGEEPHGNRVADDSRRVANDSLRVADDSRRPPPYLRRRSENEARRAAEEGEGGEAVRGRRGEGVRHRELPVVTEGERAGPLDHELDDRGPWTADAELAHAAASPPSRRPPAEQLELDAGGGTLYRAGQHHADAAEGARGSDDAEGAGDGDAVPSAFEEVVTLRLVPRQGTSFDGEIVAQGLLTAGLVRGAFHIFHYTPPGASGAVFSIANLVEPGTLREEDLQGRRLPGLTVFMLLPGPIAGVRALEEMVTCSRLLANYLDAVVQDETGSTLTRQTEEHLKERIVAFEHRRARAER